jgi:hypothetical protein
MSRDCPTHDLLDAFHRGELPPPTLDAVASHLEGCRRCEAELKALDDLADPVVAALRRPGLGKATPTRNPRFAGHPPPPPAQVGPYDLLQELGRGGMGVVWKARHTRLGREVALKLLLHGRHADAGQRARFLQEDLTQSRKGATEESKEELKRSSLLFLGGLASLRETPLTPKVTDFGIARILEGPGVRTQTGFVVGTPQDVAPEQAAGRPAGVPADVYSLGAILYELLTGRPPFQGASSLETLLLVQDAEAVPPSRLQPGVPRDLETVCLKCLRKDPGQRYPTAADLAGDLGRFLAGEPVRARPVGPVGRAAKWARRRPAVAALLAAVAAVTALGLALVLWQWGEAVAQRDLALAKTADEARARAAEEQARHEAEGERDRARRALDRAEAARYALQVSGAQRHLRAGEPGRAEVLLEACRPELRGFEHAYLDSYCCRRTRLLTTHAEHVTAVAYSPDGRLVASGDQGGAVRLVESDTGRTAAEPPRRPGQVWGLAFSPDGGRLATAGDDRTVRLWDAATGEPLARCAGHAGGVLCLGFSRDGTRLASGGGDGAVELWDAAEGHELLRLEGHAGPVTGVAFAADCRRIFSASQDRTVRCWEPLPGP